MRKRLIGTVQHDVAAEVEWLDLEHLAQVEFSSEDAAHPIEAALLPGRDSGWRAATPGAQTIRLHFDQPQQLGRILLLFVETDRARTQEFVLRWSPDDGRSFQDIVRQQWNFSPPDATREVEDYRVELRGVTALELKIIPEISGGDARASLEHLRLATLPTSA